MPTGWRTVPLGRATARANTHACPFSRSRSKRPPNETAFLVEGTPDIPRRETPTLPRIDAPRMVTRFLHRPVRSRGLSFAVGTRPSARPSRARVPDVPGDASGGGADDPLGHIPAGARPSPARCGQESPGMGGSRFSTPSLRTRSRRTAPVGFSTSAPRRSSRRSTRGARAWRPQPLYTGPRPGPGRPRAA